MMRAVFGLVLIVGMGLAGFAVYMVNQYIAGNERALQQARQQLNQVVRTTDVLTPNRPLTYGDSVTMEDFKTMPYPSNFLPEGVIRTQEELFPEGPDVERIVVLPIPMNEPFTLAKVSEPGATRGLTALVEPGTRPFPLAGRMAASFGNLRPGDRMDIYWTGRLASGTEVTRLIRQALPIIALINGNIIFQVTPEEVGLLTQAQNSGRITLSLVGADDDIAVGPISIDTRAVTGEERAVEQAPVEQEQECFITQRSGTEVIRVPIQCAE